MKNKCQICQKQLINDGNHKKFCSRNHYLKYHKIKFLKCNYCQNSIGQNKNKPKKIFCNKYCQLYYEQDKLYKSKINYYVQKLYNINLTEYCQQNNMDYNKVWRYLKRNNILSKIRNKRLQYKKYIEDNKIKKIRDKNIVDINNIEIIKNLIFLGYLQKDIIKKCNINYDIVARLKKSLSKKYINKLNENNYSYISDRQKNVPSSLKTRKKISASLQNISIEKWTKFISFEPYDINFNITFKGDIKQRDDYRCQLCQKNKKLSIHHINYDKQLTIKENCISLCNSCHSKTNYNRKHWITFFQSLLSDKCGYQYKKENIIIIKLNNGSIQNENK